MANLSDAVVPAPLWRRFAAIAYDSLLVVALAFMVSALYFSIIDRWLLGLQQAPVGFNPMLASTITVIVFAFFAYFWMKNGQTLGMQVWKIKIQQPSGYPITLWQALLRFMIAIPSLGLFMIGMLWTKLNAEQKTWQDLYSMTETVKIP